MSQKVSVEVQSDFLERLASARPTQAIAELIWNALDADATDVRVELDHGSLDLLSAIRVADNGAGMSPEEAAVGFTRLGGSWKREQKVTRGERRQLHGQEGKGRFRALGLGRVAEWCVTASTKSPTASRLMRFTVTIVRDRPAEAVISDVEAAPASASQGTEVTVSELARQWQLEGNEQVRDELATIFALYLNDYAHVRVSIDGLLLDPNAKVARRAQIPLSPIAAPGSPSVQLDLIEWSDDKDRTLHFCSESGFPLARIPPNVYAPGFSFAAYLRSPYFTVLNDENQLDLPETVPELVPVIDEARRVLKEHFRARAAERIKDLVDEWKAEDVYPYHQSPQDAVERVQRQVFDVVAVQVAKALPDFQESEQKSRRFQLRMLRQAIERGPEELQLILTEVLQLPQRQRDDLARLLKSTTLSAVISAAKLVADRLEFIEGLHAIVFRPEERRQLRERTQLHRILADNTWIFGEEFSLTVDDQSLTEVLKQHLAAAGRSRDDGEEVLRPEGTPKRRRRGIVDLALARKVPTSSPSELHHLVVELKAPKKKLSAEDTQQIKSYAFAISQDERFRNVDAKWTFWLLGNDISEFVRQEMKQPLPRGMLWRSEDGQIKIYVKAWAELLNDARCRYEFLRRELNYVVDREDALTHLRRSYERVLGTSSRQSEQEADPEPDAEDHEGPE